MRRDFIKPLTIILRQGEMGATTLSIMTFSITTLSIMTLRIKIK
jgi:hypothetical protein